jgi:AcrR family transcriptional regulator
VRDIARQAGITDAAIYYHFESKRELLDALVEERGFLNSLQNLERLTADLPLADTVIWMARGAINLMDDNREFLRLIIMEGLGGDEAAVEQYRRLIDLWERALRVVLGRYVARADLPEAAVPILARQIIYTILMAFEDDLLGRDGMDAAAVEQRRESQARFVAAALGGLLRAAPQAAR